MVHSDRDLERWGCLFVKYGLRARLGVDFERFLTNPRWYLRRLRRRSAA